MSVRTIECTTACRCITVSAECSPQASVPQILEFYASTEGTFSLFNVEGKPGATGRIPAFLAHRFLARLVNGFQNDRARGNNGSFSDTHAGHDEGIRTDPHRSTRHLR